MAKDAYFSSVAFLAHMSGANGSQVITDVLGKVITVNGNSQIVTAQQPPVLGATSSLYLGGAGDYLTIPHSADLVFPADFTLEFWFRQPATGTAFIIYDDEGANAATYGLWLSKTSSDILSVIIMPDNAANKADYPSNLILTATTAFAANTWYWVQLRRVGTQFGLAINGVQEASATLSTGVGVYSAGQPKQFGRRNNNTSYMTGYLSDFRITKGVGRAYTTPSEPLPNGGYEVSGTVLDANNSPVSRTLRAYDRVTGALLGSGVSSPGSGLYSIGVATQNEVQVVMLDDALGTLENDQILRTIPV